MGLFSMGMDQQSAENRKYIKGELLHTIFRNESENFVIAKVKVLDTNEDYRERDITLKGYFPQLQEQMAYYFYGEFEKHAKFGLQYRVHSYETYIPDTKTGLVSYLSSDLFYGVGKKTAEKIVDYLGEGAISRILNDPAVLNQVKGLNKETRETLVKSLQENQGFEHIALYLAKYNIGLKMAQKIYQEYKEEAITVLEEDPYQFVFDIDGFGFQTADEIARKNGLSATHPNRIGAGCIYVLQKSIQHGHVFLPMENCIAHVLQLLPASGLTETIVHERLKELNADKSVIISERNVYLPSLYYAEDGFASHLKRVMEKPVEHVTTPAELMKITGDIEETDSISYGKEQYEAINKAIHSKVMILTGGPGTGKTTVIKGILQAYAAIHDLSLDKRDYEDNQDYPFVLTAPTGRAAKRLAQSTSQEAATIHRLLGWDGKEGFSKGENEPLPGKILIVDEFSMVDIWLANQLFKAIPNDMQVLLVGDEDQLPSVGPGQVLSDLLEIEAIPVVRLTEVYRQKEGSKIISLAHEIKNDQQIGLQNDKDFSFFPCREDQIIDVIIRIYKKAMAKGLDVKDIQVLAPMYRSQAGITVINHELQQLLNPKTSAKREVRSNDRTFRVGDKVLQLVNQPEDGVYNGDIGEVAAIFEEDENEENQEQLVIRFENKEVAYGRKDYTNLMHAYCISIHKSQGSEFPIVILPVTPVYRRMLRKNLLYTAITRSQQSLIICGDAYSLLNGLKTIDTNKRFTSLKKQIMSRMEDLPSPVPDKEEYEISPYDFME
ncbi:ATP-dependent RecD-like DNA helicase [Virgibacillus sp. YIM 98842]|uniref:SF1B family DNA helicase RecD2 n=1 Tax=Virgibacillus sp. YIM 98842 TaxID=2663533 RepID=UPI001F09865E|nr:ATP-dependent RecD-like DNA helicase [Virgibacillus sp. YIM 98842]